MKYFLIAGEASGDLHASHLMVALRECDPEAEFRYYGGDAMKQVGGTLLCHYSQLAYMGFLPVLTHLPAILRGMKRCKQAIALWQPDVVILVDYPGFNLSIARFVHRRALCPVCYYISPKIWAWKERRIRRIRRDVDLMLSILPFEVDYYRERHQYTVHYVGNPTLDEVHAYQQVHGLPCSDGRTLALLPGSRRQEIRDNLSRMLLAAQPLVRAGRLTPVVAMAPAVPDGFYRKIVASTIGSPDAVTLVRDATYDLLSHAHVALVTSGTATLETALFGVPQAVCYYSRFGPFFRMLRRLLLRVPYISLVNLVAGREVVPELVCDHMSAARLQPLLRVLAGDGAAREAQRQGYRELTARLGTAGSPRRAARRIVRCATEAR